MSIFVAPQSEINLCKVPLEDNYKHQIQFSTVTAQKNYFNRSSVLKHKIRENTYVRENGSIVVDIPKERIQTCNYLWYDNNGFSFDDKNVSKIYYCFITRMEYLNENCTRIYYKTDCYQTWLFEINYNRSFIERQHVTDDRAGINTVPEGLETGEYLIVGKSKTNICNPNNCHVVVSSTVNPKTLEQDSSVLYGQQQGVGYYLMGGTSSSPDGRASLAEFIYRLTADEKIDAITGVFLAPDSLTGFNSITDWDYMVTAEGLSYYPFKKIDITSKGVPSASTISIDKVSQIEGYYTPRNKKILCYPYTYLLASNNNGSEATYKFEHFSSTYASFNIRGVLSPGCEIRMQPNDYKASGEQNIYGLNYGKLPILNYQVDMYTNWLTQNSINVNGLNITTDTLSTINSTAGVLAGMTMAGVGLASGNPMLAAGGMASATTGITGVTNSLIQAEKHEMVPAEARGNINCSDINFQNGNNEITFYSMTIRAEFAKILDDYFDMYGYKINRVLSPQVTGRRNWNYVKTIGCNFDGNIPNEDLAVIRQAFDNGITLWHNPDNIYNYSLPNDIVS